MNRNHRRELPSLFRSPEKRPFNSRDSYNDSSAQWSPDSLESPSKRNRQSATLASRGGRLGDKNACDNVLDEDGDAIMVTFRESIHAESPRASKFHAMVDNIRHRPDQIRDEVVSFSDEDGSIVDDNANKFAQTPSDLISFSDEEDVRVDSVKKFGKSPDDLIIISDDEDVMVDNIKQVFHTSDDLVRFSDEEGFLDKLEKPLQAFQRNQPIEVKAPGSFISLGDSIRAPVDSLYEIDTKGVSLGEIGSEGDSTLSEINDEPVIKGTDKLSSMEGPMESVHENKRPLPVLSPDQQEVIDTALKGTNFFFTGPAGTGKSFVLKEMVRQLRLQRRRTTKEKEKKNYGDEEGNNDDGLCKVAVTAFTGLAAINVDGMTLHRWSGILIEEARINPAKIVSRLRKMRENSKAVQNWHETDVLIIDEVSMVHGCMFEQLDFIGRFLRRRYTQPFGGIQIILTGDFFQLPPVHSRKDPIPRLFAFQTLAWRDAIKKTIVLKTAFRQKSESFRIILNDIRLGKFDQPKIINFLKSRTRHIPYDDGIKATHLYTTNAAVGELNTAELHKLSGRLLKYEAQDYCDETIVPLDQRERSRACVEYCDKQFMARTLLELKIGAQVMLIKNKSDWNLVNGSMGVVESFVDILSTRSQLSESTQDWDMDAIKLYNEMFNQGMEISDGLRAKAIEANSLEELESISASHHRSQSMLFPLVRFSDGSRHIIGNEAFEQSSANGEVILASREQLPLIHSWALTVHKAQGQSIERLFCDLKGVFEPGQVYVALSRAIDPKYLQIKNLDPTRIKANEFAKRFHQDLEEGRESTIDAESTLHLLY